MAGKGKKDAGVFARLLQLRSSQVKNAFKSPKMTLNRCTKFIWHRRVVFSIIFTCLIIYYSGLLLYVSEKDFRTEFSYPLLLDNLSRLVSNLKMKRKVDVNPINQFQYEFLSDSAHKCRNELLSFEPVRLLFVVKSSLDHFDRRKAIRQSWGWTKRFSDVEIRTVFLLGIPSHPDIKLQARLDEEQVKNMDLVQAKFVDTYYNNTIKTMMGFHWVVTHCPKAQFILYVDDDYYVSAKNVLRYLRRPGHYPRYLQRAFLSINIGNRDKPRPKVGGLDFDWAAEGDSETNLDKLTSETQLYTGFVFPNSKPHRVVTSQWYITLEEYPFDRYPPYVTAGAYLLSYESLLTMYYASFYTVPFRFDDIYVGILAKRAGILPLHNPNFCYYKRTYSKTAYAYLIASHGFGDPEELLDAWNEQRTLGNA